MWIPFTKWQLSGSYLSLRKVQEKFSQLKNNSGTYLILQPFYVCHRQEISMFDLTLQAHQLIWLKKKYKKKITWLVFKFNSSFLPIFYQNPRVSLRKLVYFMFSKWIVIMIMKMIDAISYKTYFKQSFILHSASSWAFCNLTFASSYWHVMLKITVFECYCLFG